MKMEFWLLILVLCHATNSIESVNSPPNNVKIYKTFDEIFGEGWDDEEKPNLLGPNESQRMEASSTENCHENSHHNEQNGSEKSPVQTEHNELDGFDEVQEADKLFDSNEQNNQKNSEKYENKTIYSDDQKREIVQEYIKLKSQYCQKQKENVSKKEWNKFKANAAKKLGVRYNNVCRWQKQFGIDKKVKRCYDDRKCEIVQKYIELKNKFMQEKKHLHNEWDQFFASIPKELGVSHSTILKWQKQFFGVNINNKKKYTDEEKQEKLKKYYEIKLSNSKTKDTDIAADLEISIGSLTRWKFKHSPELNMPVPSSTKSYSDDRKREIAQEYIELKNKFMQEKKHSQNEWNQFYANISKELYVSHSTILKWQKQFFGVNINNIKKKYTDEEKQEKLKEYYEMKLSNPKTKDTDIAADLKISHKTLIKWKAKFKNVPELNVQVPGSIKSYSDDRKREIVQEFIELKNKFLHEKKHSQNEWNQFYAYIPKELGVSHSTILKWKKQLEPE